MSQGLDMPVTACFYSTLFNSKMYEDSRSVIDVADNPVNRGLKDYLLLQHS
jgi:hypothetical protein